MRVLAAATLAMALSSSGMSFAQDAVTGTYKGSFSAGNVVVGVTVTIESVENGRSRGTARLSGGPCVGDYPFSGFVKGADLGMKGAGTGTAPGCSFGFLGKVEGNRLVGRMGSYDVVLNK